MSRAGGARERLASPFGLVVAAVAFAAAFALLAPPREAFTLASGGTDGGPDGGAHAGMYGGTGRLDELTLAYLGARAADGDLGDEEALAAVISLAGEGRVAEARALLAASPATAFDPAARARLDLELTAGELRRALAEARSGGGPSGGVEAPRSRLAAQLAELLRRPPLHVPELLEHAALLSERFGEVRTGAALERRLAEIDPPRAAHWYARCGRRLAAAGMREEALDCLGRAHRASASGDERFALGLALFEQLPAASPSGDAAADGTAADGATSSRTAPSRTALVERLLEEASALDERPSREGATVSPHALESLAGTLLAAELPGAAARAYARLAERDAGQRVRWLGEAARWSEAAARPAEAAVFLDAMTPLLAAAERPAHERRIEALLLGAGRGREALDRLAARLAREPLDAALVREAVAAARAAGQQARALGWNTLFLGAHGDDREAIERQIALTLALGRTDLARYWTERALAQEPDSAVHLERLARLAEWAGEPEAALAHRQRLLALRTGAEAGDTLLEIARLAESVRRPGVAARALERHMMRVAPEHARIERLVRLHELDGRPDRAAAALEASMLWHGVRASTLATLAALHRRHVHYPEALDAWERLAARYGRSGPETLARVELLWRLGRRDEAAALAPALETLTFAGAVSDYQTTLLAEIGWRYRLAGVAALAKPLLATLENEERRLQHGRRSVRAAIEAGNLAVARRDAETLWRASGEPELGLLALRLAVEGDERETSERLLDDPLFGERLREESGYWSLRAVALLREGDADGARRAWERALGISPQDAEALGGLLWLHIAEGDDAALAAALRRASALAAGTPTLWTAFAVGHLRLGEAAVSLPWFERALNAPKADYGLWLTYADALEQAGRAARAARVRRHAIAELRPRLRDALADERDELLQQYARMLVRYGGVAANEAWMRRALAATPAADAATLAWREDMAISWLMATERHEHARLFMARLHDARLDTPPWRTLALALGADDEAAVAAVLETSGGALSAGDRILALRRVGREAEAWRLARETLDGASGPAASGRVAEQYAAMRRHRPNDAAVRVVTHSREGLSIEESGVALRRTLGDAGIGLGLDVARRRLVSDGPGVIGEGERHDTRSAFEASLFRSGERRSAELSIGILDDGEESHAYGSARYARRDLRARRELALGLGWNEAADDSPALRLSATRDRAEVGIESGLGMRVFTRLSAELDELATRGDDRRLARGLNTRAELGLRGGLGALDWSGSVVAEDMRRDRESAASEALGLPSGTTLDGVLARRASTLSLNASLARGEGASASPRYYLGGGLSHVWPERAVGVRIDGGAGFRVLGEDELAIAFGRDAAIAGTRARADVATFRLSYRRRF